MPEWGKKGPTQKKKKHHKKKIKKRRDSRANKYYMIDTVRETVWGTIGRRKIPADGSHRFPLVLRHEQFPCAFYLVYRRTGRERKPQRQFFRNSVQVKGPPVRCSLLAPHLPPTMEEPVVLPRVPYIVSPPLHKKKKEKRKK